MKFFEMYRPIDDTASRAFAERGLALATELFGPPAIPVNTLYLRHSTPLDPNHNLKRGFQLCEISDRQQGIFTIYLGRWPTEYSFHGQLGHEIAHLLNADLYDAYVEGLNTAFAERLLRKEQRDWTRWETYYENDDPFYGHTYRMMKQVWDVVGDEHIRRFLSYAVPSGDERKMHINIDGWLDSLPDPLRTAVLDIVRRNFDTIEPLCQGCMFLRPRDLH